MPYNKLLQQQLDNLNFDTLQSDQISSLLALVNETYEQNEQQTKKAEENLELINTDYALRKTKLKSDIKEIGIKHEQITSNLNTVLYKLDKKGNILYLNSAWETLTGFSVEESIDKPYNIFLKDENGNPFIAEVPDKNSSNKSSNTTVQILNKKKQLVWLEIFINSVFLDDGSFDGYVGSITDNTEIKKTEHQLIQANKAKSEFLSTMSHEIRTPLNAVIGIAHLLLIENPKPEQLENISTLKYSSEHLLALVNDILDYNKIVSGSLQLEQASFSLSEVLLMIEGIFKIRAAAKNIHFQISRDDLIQDTLIGDKTRLTQIITNLIGNAIKFTNQGAVTLEVNIESQTVDSSNLIFVIRDTGVGIKEENIGKIFDSFAQAGTETTRLYGGSGLGLAICQKLLTHMKSDIKVESTYGMGSTFTFPLCFKKGNPVAALIAQKDTEKSSTENIELIEGLKVLVVEDNKINILVIEKFLKRWKLDYDFAQNGQIGVECAFKKEYDVILMDIQMPVMNGYDASIAIRASENTHNKNIPIFALTASTGEDIMKDVISHGMNGLIGKPFKPDYLIETLMGVAENIKISDSQKNFK